MKRAYHLMAKIEHRLMEIAAEHWFLCIILAIIGFVLFTKILRTIRINRFIGPNRTVGSDRGRKRPSHPKFDGANGRARASLKRLSSSHYTVFPDLYMPRLAGEGTTHLDYVVVSGQGIFVIQLADANDRSVRQSKTRAKLGKAGGKHSPLQNILQRNDYHVKALAAFLKQPESIFRSIIYGNGVKLFDEPLPSNVIASGLGRYICSQPVEPDLPPERTAFITLSLAKASEQMDRDAERLPPVRPSVPSEATVKRSA